MADESQQQIFDFTIVVTIFVAILTVYVMLSYLIEIKKIKYLHESTVAILMGVLTAVFCKYGLKTQIFFSNQLFFAIILPPIIFSSGFSLRKSDFFQNIGLICFYGIIGTIIGFILISLVLIFLDRTFFHALSLSQLLIIASVLCATDTVSASALIKVIQFLTKANKYPVLHSVLFGQSIINDAIAIILFRAVSEIGHTRDEQFGFKVILEMSLSFLYLFTFSMLLGIVSGLSLSYLFRRFSFFSKHPIKQTSIVLLNGYFTYLLGEIFALSGIITLFTQSIIIGHYAFMNLSEQSKKGTGMAFETVSYMAEAFVFAYLGASILSISQNWIAAVMALILLLFLPFIRAFMVYILPGLYKLIGRQFHLKPKELKVCWFSGMIRGVIAFALCLQIQTENKEFVTSLVLVIVLFTTVGGSSFLNKFIQIIKLEKSTVTQELQHLNRKYQFMINSHLNEQKDLQIQVENTRQEVDVPKQRSRIIQKLISFESKYMRPMFGKVSQVDLSAEIPIALQSRSGSNYEKQSMSNPCKSEESQTTGADTQCISPTRIKRKLKNWKPSSQNQKVQ